MTPKQNDVGDMRMSEIEFQVLLTRAAEAGAKRALADAGIDSLSTFELRNRIEHETGLSLPLDRFAKATRFSELAALLAALAAEVPHRTG